MTRATDTFLLTGLQYQQISAGRILVTPSGGTQTTLAYALSANGFANLNLPAILPTTAPGVGKPWLNGNATDGYVLMASVSGAPPPPPEPPAAPTALMASSVTADHITLSWTA